MSTTTNPAPATKKEARMSSSQKTSKGVIAIAMFAAWMWHAAESATPGITQTETNRAGTAVAGMTSGAITAGRDIAQQSGIGNVLNAPATAPASQLGGVADSGQ